MESSSRPQVYQYSDYRVFIADMYLYRKSINPKFSYHYIARKLDTSRGYLKNVIDGRRHITLERIYPLSEVFGLDSVEIDFFMMLVCAGITEEEKLKSRFTRVTRRLISNVNMVHHNFDDLEDGMYYI